MMSQGTKAKEVRDYFIAVEKEYMASQSQSPLTEILPVLQSMMQMMSMILKNQQEQVPQHLSPEQLGKIRGAINLATIPIMEFYNEEVDNIKKVLYSKLNNRLGVPSYIYIQANAFDEAMTLINDTERRYEMKLEQRKEMQVDINKEF
jgi:glutamate formiminotransferase